MKKLLLPAFLLVGCSLVLSSLHAADTPPLKVLLITGGCCHDYAKQKDILKKGLEERANLVVTQIHTDDKSTAPPLPIYGNPDYAKGYDAVIHDECASSVSDEETVKGVLAPHREGIPGVNLHCAMHSYRIGNPNDPVTDLSAPHAFWFEYLGLQSSRHDAQEPIDVKFIDKEHPITKGLSDWTTMKEEHYNNIKVLDTAHALAQGTQTVHPKKKQPDGAFTIEPDRTDIWVDVWTNLYKGKTRVFSTTLGHNNETVADGKYLDLVTRGLLWSCDKLDADGNPKAGYGPGGK
jgi:type 1 glutamine amidotransferase